MAVRSLEPVPAEPPEDLLRSVRNEDHSKGDADDDHHGGRSLQRDERARRLHRRRRDPEQDAKAEKALRLGWTRPARAAMALVNVGPFVAKHLAKRQQYADA